MEVGQWEICLKESKASWGWTRGSVVDMAYAITLGVIDERAAGKVYNVGEPEALSTKEWVEAIGQAAGWEGEVVVIPDEVQPDGQQNNLNFKQDLVVDSNRIRHELGYAELTLREEALKRSVAWGAPTRRK